MYVNCENSQGAMENDQVNTHGDEYVPEHFWPVFTLLLVDYCYWKNVDVKLRK